MLRHQVMVWGEVIVKDRNILREFREKPYGITMNTKIVSGMNKYDSLLEAEEDRRVHKRDKGVKSPPMKIFRIL